MGMTIDKSIETLTSILAEATANEDAVCYVTSADAPALKKAIDSMHKYQKIQEIYLKWNRSYDKSTSDAWSDVIGVLEDGKTIVIEEMLDCFMRLKHAIEEGENVDSTKYVVYPVAVSFKKEHCMEVKEAINDVVCAMCAYRQLKDFARWVATEVIDEEMWTYNHLSFTEIACRKLVKLGIMQESNGKYTYEEEEDGNDDR